MLRVAYATLFVALTCRSPFHGVYYNGERVRFDRGDDAARVCCFHSHIVRDIKLPFPDQRLIDRVAKNQLKSCHSMPLVKSLENVVSINWIMHLRYGFLAKNGRAKLASRRARKRVAEFDKNPQGRGRLWTPLGRRTGARRGSDKRDRWRLHVYGRGSMLTCRVSVGAGALLTCRVSRGKRASLTCWVSIRLRAPSRMGCDRADLVRRESEGWIVCGSRQNANEPEPPQVARNA